jgi:cardiolipin synthase (CMP-forming)
VTLRISANQVTLLRLVLLPLPIAMVYRNTHAWMLGALALYVVLGLTDALDGYLARKHGATPLGALLDPVVDKIFLVAGFVPMADFQILPTSLVFVLFIRELAVTALRSIALEEGFTFRTSNIAKLKTTVQMAGAGLMLLVWLYPDRRAIGPVLGVIFAGALVPAAWALAHRHRPGWMAWSAAGFFGAALLTRLLLPPPASIVVIMAVIVAITLYSGAEYAWGMRGVLAERFRRSPLEAFRLAGLSLVVPVFYLPALDRSDDPTVAILGLLAAEFAQGGLDNSLAQMGHARGVAPDLTRSAVQAACGILLLWALLSGRSPGTALLVTVLALGVTVGDLLGRFWRHRGDFASAPDRGA